MVSASNTIENLTYYILKQVQDDDLKPSETASFKEKVTLLIF